MVVRSADPVGILDFRLKRRDQMSENDEVTEAQPIAGVFLGKEEQERLQRFLEVIDLLISSALPPKLKEVYDIAHSLEGRVEAGFGWTSEGYIDFLNECVHVKEITGLPFSIDKDNAGLSWDDWNDAIDASLQNWKGKLE
jgi:hypothetical protein